MPFYYSTGETIAAGDRVRYHGEAAEIEFVADPACPDPQTSWAVEQFGGGVMIAEPAHFGLVFVSALEPSPELAFVARAQS